MKLFCFITRNIDTLITTSECHSNQCEYGISNSVHLLSGAILSTSVVTAIISTIHIAVIMTLSCEVKCWKIIKATSSSTHSHEIPLHHVAGPLYSQVDVIYQQRFTTEFLPKCSLSVYVQQIIEYLFPLIGTLEFMSKI